MRVFTIAGEINFWKLARNVLNGALVKKVFCDGIVINGRGKSSCHFLGNTFRVQSFAFG